MKNKVAVVIGGAKSLGKYLTTKLVENNYKVWLIDINEELGKKTANVIGNKAQFIKCDASNEVDLVNMIDIIESSGDIIDTLIYNAGIAKAAKVTVVQKADIQKSLDVNYIGYFLTSKHIANHMIKNHVEGTIININSKSGKIGSKHNGAYSGAKFGAIGITQSIALDLGDHRINVNSLMLGNLLDSDMFNSLLPQYAKKLNLKESEVKPYYINKVPLKRGCTFEDVANVMLFYISDKAKYITGQSINITGGQVMN